MLKTILAVAALFAATPAIAQVRADTPDEAKKRMEFYDAPQNQKIIVSAAIAFNIRDSRDLCGFKLTAFAERMIAGAEQFATAEQKSQAEMLANNTRPRAPLVEFCNTMREEFAHAPVKWLAE